MMIYDIKILKYAMILWILTLSINPIFSQDGWEKIKNNNNVAAKKIFLEQLQVDSTTLDALCGMIYISELENDDLSYSKYINTLICTYKKPEHYLLFKNDFNRPAEKLAFTNDLAKTATTTLKFEMAENLFSERKFTDSRNAYAEIAGNYDWSVIGPFRSISGYGFLKEYDIELGKFDTSKYYESGYGTQYKWVQRKYRNEDGIVLFSDNLPDEFGDDVYFANTFINLPTKQKIQFRIARNSPVKIWIDDNLVFQNDENLSFQWDNEICEMTLDQGDHRILVKCATLASDMDDDNFLAYHDDNSGAYFNYNYDDYFNNYSSWFGSYHSDELKFAIRITDTTGNLEKNISSAFSGVCIPAKFETDTYNNKLIEKLKKNNNKGSDSLFNDYMLCKAFLFSNEIKDAEEYFVKRYRKNPDMVFYKFLAAKIYAANGKNEKAYLILNDIDDGKTPVFVLSYEDLNKLDKDEDDKDYTRMLFRIDSLYPSNWTVIQDMISYYQKKGLNDEKKKYLKEKIATYPVYKKSLDEFLEDENYKPYEYKPETDHDRKKDAARALKNLKKHYDYWDYETLITFYKNKEKYDKVLDLYNEIISLEPYMTSYLLDKANFLYTREKYDEALDVLFSTLKMTPYSASLLETIGDIYSDKKDKEQALDFYSRALALERYEYDRKDIDEKIEKLSEKDNIKEYFVTKSFDDILMEKEWGGKYTDEKSVVLMYSKDVCLDQQKTTHIYQKMMIQILTDDGARMWTESDFSFMGDLSYVKVVKKNGAEITPDMSYGYVVFKDLEPGDIIKMEGSYEGFQENEFNDAIFLMNYISFGAPLYYSKTEVLIPDSLVFIYDCHKVQDNVIRKNENGYNSYKWEYYDVAKQETEEDVYDGLDPYAYIWGTTIPDWSVLSDWYKQKTYKKLEPTYEIREALDTIIKKEMTPFEKVEAVYNYVCSNINYSYVDFLQSNYIPKSPGHTLSAGIGDCKDVATLMITMLRELDIESYYVLVKTNRYFHKYILPCMLFDHVIVAYVVDGKTYYADPTSNYYPYYCLNENDADAYALLIRDGEKDIFKLYNYYSDPSSNMQEIIINADFAEDRSITVKAAVTTKGIEAGYLREVINPMTLEEQKKFIPEYFGEQLFENMKVSSFDFGDLKDISQPLKSTIELTAENYGDKIMSMLIFRIPFVRTILSTTSLNKEKRYSALDLSQILNTAPVIQDVSIKIPPDYQLMEDPEDVLIENKFGKYELIFSKITGGIGVKKTLIFKSRVVEPEDFDAFRKFYNEIKSADESKLSIKKKE